MNLTEFFAAVGRVRVPKNAPAVCRTIEGELGAGGPHRVDLALGAPPAGLEPPQGPWACFQVEGRRALLCASDAGRLYSFFRWLVETRGKDPIERYSRPRLIAPAFAVNRPVYDIFFAQSARSIRGLDREAYAAEMARAGFTHLEVNSLAFPEALEEGAPGEVYPRFYTYLPALDQFVDSFLNRGIYPKEYLEANLARLAEGAELAARHGLVPMLTCFEPRSVPERLLQRHPELRGCRVDHPFRSFRPRFNLAVSHPVVRAHYRELLLKLLRRVPSIGGLSVWSNDSGAGFEYTRSLYVGANGSAYLAREWSAADVFAKAAAENVLGFLRLLRDAGREANPGFRVATRLEPFGAERGRIVAGLGDGLDVEVPTLLAEGWASPYGHPKYPDSRIGPFTVFNNRFDAAERPALRALERRGCRVYAMHAHGPTNNFEPLLMVPSPWLAGEKLQALRGAGARHLAHFGGVAPPAAVPFAVNDELYRRYLWSPGTALEELIRSIASDWAGPEAPALLRAWRLVDQAVRGFMPHPLFFLWGVWYRVEIRPLVPDIEAIPERDRAYYEKHMLTTHHNPGRVDLGKDVLFDLMTAAEAEKAVRRIEKNALPPLERALAALAGREGPVFADLRPRLEALRCWMRTRQAVAVWIAEVHAYLGPADRARRAEARKRLRAMVAAEIANTREWLALWEEAEVEFMAVSRTRETTFIYDRNFGAHLRRKLALMEDYGGREPRIDREIMWRVAGRRNLV